MNKNIKNGAQAGFTLIELIVVIVILGILAATALPKFSDLGGDARLAKMKAAVGAVRSASAMVHGSFLAAGSPVEAANNSKFNNSVLTSEGVPIAFHFGYPDVGGDGVAITASSAPNSGIVVAAGNLLDYTTTATPTVLTVRPDADPARPNCYFTYTEPTAVNLAPQIDDTRITLANCK